MESTATDSNWYCEIKCRWALAGGLLLLGASLPQSKSNAQQLFSFELGLDGWTAEDVSLVQSTFGVTDGSMSMLLDNLTPMFKNDVGKTNEFNGNRPGFENAYDLFLIAAEEIANGKTPKLEFDLTANLSNVSADGFLQLGLYVNSSSGFTQYGTGNFIGGDALSTFPIGTAGQAEADGMTLTPTGVANQVRVAVPLGPTLKLAQNSTFFDLGFKSNGDWIGTVDLAIDDIRLTGLPEFSSETIFSWETPDNLATPDVNEQLENWTEGFGPGHVHSLTSTGATDGTTALQIDRQSLDDPTFTWGSQFVLDADADPSVQAKIDTLAGKLNGAHAIAFDVRFDDAFPNTPTFTKFGLGIADASGSFYGGEGASFNGEQEIGATGTVTIRLDALLDDGEGGSGLSLAEAGISDDSDFLQIIISSNTNGAGIYQIDNFRILTALAEPTADIDNDGDVDGHDFLELQRTDPSLLTLWESQFGTELEVIQDTLPVPEPAAWWLAGVGLTWLVRFVRFADGRG